MPRYRVSWKQYTECWATVDAETPEDAVELAKAGGHNADVDTEPGRNIGDSYRCDGEAYPTPSAAK